MERPAGLADIIAEHDTYYNQLREELAGIRKSTKKRRIKNRIGLIAAVTAFFVGSYLAYASGYRKAFNNPPPISHALVEDRGDVARNVMVTYEDGTEVRYEADLRDCQQDIYFGVAAGRFRGPEASKHGPSGDYCFVYSERELDAILERQR